MKDTNVVYQDVARKVGSLMAAESKLNNIKYSPQIIFSRGLEDSKSKELTRDKVMTLLFMKALLCTDHMCVDHP